MDDAAGGLGNQMVSQPTSEPLKTAGLFTHGVFKPPPVLISYTHTRTHTNTDSYLPPLPFKLVGSKGFSSV